MSVINQQHHSIKYDPNVIIASANDKFQSGGDLEGASLVFQSALLTWVDDARETSDDSLQESIATLWLAYAQFLAGAKQFKSSMEAYEQAITCPMAQHSGRVWLEYARFAMERNKPKTAQGVFVRALSGGPNAPALDEQDQQLLWNEFLDMMRTTTGNSSLSLADLQSAVRDQPSQDSSTSTSLDVAMPDAASSLSSSSLLQQQPPLKRPRLDPTFESTPPEEESKTHVVTEDAVQSEATALTELLSSSSSLPDEIYGAWIMMDGNDTLISMPPSLFQPSPPKLSDPTGKDVMGLDVALRLIQKLSDSTMGAIVLEVCKALWTLQVVTEQSTSKSLERFDATKKDHATSLQSNLKTRLSVSTAATRAAVEMMNENEWRAFDMSVNQQRQSLLTQRVWEHRRLLCLQQILLTKMGVPEFDGPTIDSYTLDRQASICSYLHSAFYLRSRIGEQPHRTMLLSQIKRLEKEVESSMHHTRSHSPVMTKAASAHSPRLSPVPPSTTAATANYPPPRTSPYNPMQPPQSAYSMPPPPPPPHSQLALPQLRYQPPAVAAAPPPQSMMMMHPQEQYAPSLPPMPMGQMIPPITQPPGGYFQQQQQQQPQPPPPHLYPYKNYPS